MTMYTSWSPHLGGTGCPRRVVLNLSEKGIQMRSPKIRGVLAGQPLQNCKLNCVSNLLSIINDQQELVTPNCCVNSLAADPRR